MLVAAGPAAADGPRAVDRLEPSERGSDWFASESLDLRGRLRPSVGYVLTYARREVVDGGTPVVEDVALLHVGGGAVIADRLRASANLTFQPYAGGRSSAALEAPPREGGIGDLRLGLDARLFGAYGRPITAAAGVQVWAPTGERRQWASDGVVRARPRIMLAGTLGAFVWAASAGAFARPDAEITATAAAGARLFGRVVVGPEIVASTEIARPFATTATPVEVLASAHGVVAGGARVGAGLGAGLGDGLGAPAWRAVLTLEWLAEIEGPASAHGGRAARGRGRGRRPIEPDRDRDGVPDAADACPDVVGISTRDPRTNGCPPDADGDGIDDVADACPTVPGIATSDPATNGCPDRDRDEDGIPNELDACPDRRGAPDVDPARNGCPKAFVKGDAIVLLDPIVWDGARLAPGEPNEALLTALLAAVLELPESRRLRIEGHTDARGDPEANRRLSAARAAALAAWLVDHGVDRARIATVGFGGDRPIDTNATEAGRAENRRIEIHLEP